jgi:hypothetical protein
MEALGALLSSSPSCLTPANKNTSEASFNQDSSFPLTPIIFAPFSFNVSTVAFNSCVSPLFDIAITISPFATCPLEPCTASVPSRV